MKNLLVGLTLIVSMSSFADIAVVKSDFNIPAYNFPELLDETNCSEYLAEKGIYTYSPVTATIVREMERLEIEDILSGTHRMDFVQPVKDACQSQRDASISHILEKIADDYLHPIFFTEVYKKH